LGTAGGMTKSNLKTNILLVYFALENIDKFTVAIFRTIRMFLVEARCVRNPPEKEALHEMCQILLCLQQYYQAILLPFHFPVKWN
jgi:hypothetical protein